jgi:hypothetical protein
MDDSGRGDHEYLQYALEGYKVVDKLDPIPKDTPGVGTVAWYWQEYMT